MVYGGIRCKAKAVSGWVMSDVLQVNVQIRFFGFWKVGRCAVQWSKERKGFCEERI
jgi:hypothetical protein